ncbi:pyrimidine-specific ribonucleoside hydrolase [Trypanosoma rangeli]|uniref:Pyrimidine-specific ribonucleoside hydrolase n=1 Tax=Trypanosoma rangeli TaxID=5698 RepID=A0A3R7KKT6_TRYRA|nr:pyrimidine-specific ribonucleoside hydrolase [Trypanosoma rangeli]RNF09453.1 pyrimidine-specific ribonucleoside hydrolase [Trypanosoma rangeli]|eukprot:RNF09453.1 pyrimidine-specific ribonucleoside hydrolase [Trypanosoma rangeli]
MDRLQQWQTQWKDLPQPRKIKALRFVVFGCYAFALFFLVIYAFGGTKKRVSEPARVVVFMETTPGALMALRYLAKRADVSIAMIVLTVNAWNANLNAAYDNTAAFLAMLKGEAVLKYDVPVYYGSSVAQVNARFNDEIMFPVNGGEAPNTTACTYRRVIGPGLSLAADSLFGASELLDGVPLFVPGSGHGDGDDDGDSLLGQYEFFNTPLSRYLSDHAAAFLVLGPATDAASFLQQQHPKIRAKVNHIFLAGGALKVKGDTCLVYPPNWRSEQHTFFDPLAANYIVSGAHGRPVDLLPLDALPQWPTSLYAALITSRVDPSTTSSSLVDASARVVARAFIGYSKQFGIDKLMPVEVLAAPYFADAVTRGGATVAEMSLLVANGFTMSTDGLIGAPSSVQPQKKSFRVKVVLHLNERMFWSRLEAVDRLRI